ncbi:DUF309 domain-containing protein [Staphylospora marina]|uniref:DUF309 domain-containing protein n=1 Tax=Staphylospora marina TaxID=2490858 RepID=UPI000F5C27B0|nr:DUF309 domain-containing protein [Staphylospora marina]
MKEYPRLYVDFLHYFNVERDYYECHEVLEELWLEEGRDPFWQGLLQVAVALHHHRNGNLNGARKLFAAALDKLGRFPEAVRAGIDLAEVKRESTRRLDELLHATEGSSPAYEPFEIRILDEELRRLVTERKSRPPEEHDGE